MTAPDPKLLSAWKHVLTLSKVKPGEAVTLLVSSNTNAQNYAAANLAASELGATVTTVTLPRPTANCRSAGTRRICRRHGPQRQQGGAGGAENSDLVIDLMLLLFSPEQAKILEGGTRMLLAVEPPEVLMRILPSMGDKDRVMAAGGA